LCAALKVGYGDITPKTTLGKVTNVGFLLFGIVSKLQSVL